jgi:hypothetical protein
MKKHIIIIIIISFLIYSIFFCRLGNTCFRIDSMGVERFNLIPLLTEGFIGPIRSLFLLLFNGNFWGTIQYISFESTNLANPFFTFLIVNSLYDLLKKNKVL